MRHMFAAAAGSFCFVTTENGKQQDMYNLTTMTCVQRPLYLNERLKFRKELMVKLETSWDDVRRPAGEQQE